jgi:hypothetical protein
VLYRPEAFEPLVDVPWDGRRIRAEIREIVADADRACHPEQLWPADEWDAWTSPLPLKNLYVGGTVPLPRHGRERHAFLKAFERTGDERWLERARRFAVHALAQVRRGRAARGRGRYSLWTGDMGVALYAADCLDSRTAYPIVDALS